jgi:hypothetical protein
MKKIYIALMLLVVIIAPIFAESATLDVKTSVASVSKYGFTTTAYTSVASDPVLISTEQALSGTSSDYYVAVKTNSASKVSVKVYNTPLKLEGGTETVALSLNGGTHGDSSNALEVIATTADTETGLRALSAKITLSYVDSALQAATVGTYKSTVTMVVAGI